MNVEAIANHAVLELPSTVSSDPISADWRRKFFFEAENVCEADMQILWGKILAGEITKPGAFSLRTLDSLRHISHDEAEVFRKACSIAMSDGWIAVPGGSVNHSLQPYGLKYDDILVLRDAGLLLSGDQIVRTFDEGDLVQGLDVPTLALSNNGVEIRLIGAGFQALHIPILIFSKVGIELQKLMTHAENPQYLTRLGQHLRQQDLAVKRGVHTPQDGSFSVISYDDDL